MWSNHYQNKQLFSVLLKIVWKEVVFSLSKNPKYRKTKRYTKEPKTFTIDNARNLVLKIKELEGLSKNTIFQYEKVFNDFDRFFGDKTDIATLTKESARNFIHWQIYEKEQFANHKYKKNKKKGVSVGTVNTYLAYSKSIFEVLLSENVVDENIFQDIKKIKQKEKRVKTVSIEEINKLLRSLNKEWYSEFRMYVLIHVLLDSFGRINEVLSLRKSEVDYDKQAITFQRTKNGKIRIVPITKKTVKLIEELNDETEDFNSDFIFLSNHGTPLKPDTARKHLRELTKRIGLEHITGFHVFRHTASELFLRQNGSMRVLQKILGHSDISTTSIYAHVLDETIKNQHEKFSPLNLINEKVKRKTRTNRKRR